MAISGAANALIGGGTRVEVSCAATQRQTGRHTNPDVADRTHTHTHAHTRIHSHTEQSTLTATWHSRSSAPSAHWSTTAAQSPPRSEGSECATAVLLLCLSLPFHGADCAVASLPVVRWQIAVAIAG